MPLIHSASKKAFKKNVETEMKDHPGNRAQNLAIAYSTKRAAMAKHRKRMADGGSTSSDMGQTLGSVINYPGAPKTVKKAEGGRIEAPKPVGGMRMHTEEDTEYGKGQPGMRTPEPMEDDEMAQQKLPGEMNRRPNGSVKMASYQGEADRYTDTTSEMGHFAKGGYIPEEIEGARKQHDSEDSEYGRGQPGSTATPLQQHLEEQNMRSDADGIRPGGSIHMASYQDEADEYADSSSEMDHFAHGGKARKRYDIGGGVSATGGGTDSEIPPTPSSSSSGKSGGSSIGKQAAETFAAMEAEGGEINANNPKLQQAYMTGKPKSIHESIMRKKRMADGGEVDLDLNGMEEGEDSLGSAPLGKLDHRATGEQNYDAGMKEMYGDDDDENMHGDSILERIRKKIMSR